jgi:CheY-like chemotaxis protein
MPDELAKPGRILLADDDPASLLLLEEILRPVGYECVCASDAASAKKILEESEIDLLISDIQMPGNSELQLLQGLPQLAAGLQVILVTAKPSFETAAQSVRLPVVAYLTKPPNPEELRQMVHNAVESHRAFRLAKLNRRRMQDWTREVEQIENLLCSPPAGVKTEAISTLISVNLRNLLESLLTVAQLAELLAGDDHAAEAARLINGARPIVLLDAIRETILALERTKHVFKSKELADVRRKLEGLIRA